MTEVVDWLGDGAALVPISHNARAEKLDRDETEPENGDAFSYDLPANEFQYALHPLVGT